MSDFRAAMETIERGLEIERIGQPVAVRIVAQLGGRQNQLLPLASKALARAGAWFSGEPRRLTVGGSAELGQVTVLASFEGGQTALVSAGSCGVDRPLLAVEVWCSRGILSWEDDRLATALREELTLAENETALLRKIEASLGQSGSQPTSDDTRRQGSVASEGRKTQAPPYGILLVAGDHTHQPNYVQAMAADKRCRLIGLTDEADVSAGRKKLNEQLAERLGIPILPDLEKALARDDVHAVSICAEPIRRGRIAVAAAEAGKHLYLDKPLAGSLRESEAIVAAVRKAGVVGHMFSSVHGEAAACVKAVCESGELGDLRALHFDLCFAKGEAGRAKLGTPRKESAAPERFELVDSKREMSNVGVYPLALLLSLTGRRVRRVTATTGNYFFAEHQKNGMEDFAQMLLELEGGLVASLSVGRTGWHSNPGGGLNRAFLIGTESCTMIDASRPRVEVWGDVEPWSPPARNPEDPMGMWLMPPDSPFTAKPRNSWLMRPSTLCEADLGHFLDCIEHGRQPAVSAEVAAATTDVLMAGYQSAAAGKTVTLPP